MLRRLSFTFSRSAVLASALLLAFSISPAIAQKTPPPLGRTLLVPHTVVSGERATLAVLDSRGRLAPAVNVIFSNGDHFTTDATGRVVFVAPQRRCHSRIHRRFVLARSGRDHPSVGSRRRFHPTGLRSPVRFPHRSFRRHRPGILRSCRRQSNRCLWRERLRPRFLSCVAYHLAAARLSARPRFCHHFLRQANQLRVRRRLRFVRTRRGLRAAQAWRSPHTPRSRPWHFRTGRTASQKSRPGCR